MLTRLKGQSTLEYAMIIAVVVGALLAMQIYMKRGVQGKLRESTDEIGAQFDAEKTSISRTVNRSGTTTQTIEGGVTTTETTDEKLTETGKDEVEAWE